MVDVVQKDIQCHFTTISRPTFSEICIVLSGYYLQLLSVITSRKWLEYEHGSGQYVNVHLLDQPSRDSNLWEHMTVLRQTGPARQSSYISFMSMLNQLPTVTQSSSAPLLFRSSGQHSEEYKSLWKYFNSKNNRYVDIKTMILGATNKFVNQHNEAALNAFPDSVVSLYSSTTVETNASTQDRQDHPAPVMLVLKRPTSSVLRVYLPSSEAQERSSVIVILSLLHPTLVNSEMFVLKAHTKGVVQIPYVDTHENDTVPYALHRIKIQFSYHGAKSHPHTVSISS